MRALPLPVFLLVAVLLNMCQDTGTDAVVGAMNAASAGVGGEEAALRVGAAGGTIHLTQGPAKGAAIVIPPGALTQPVMITMRAGGPPTNLPPGVESAGPIVTFGPEGQTFLHPVSITLPTTRPANMMYTRPHGNGPWTQVPGASPDGAQHMVAELSHFSDVGPAVFIVGGQDAPPDVHPATGYLLAGSPLIAGGGRGAAWGTAGKFYFYCRDDVFCSVNLYAQDRAVTAGHCTSDHYQPPRPNVTFAVGFGSVCAQNKGIIVTKDAPVSVGPGANDKIYLVKDFKRADGYAEASPTDVAKLILYQSVENIQPAPLPSVDSAASLEGQCAVMGVGYGVTNASGEGPTGERKSAIFVIGDAGRTTAKLLSVKPCTGETCFGDSGGGYYDGDTLIGIESAGGSTTQGSPVCDPQTSVDFAPMLFFYRDWLLN